MTDTVPADRIAGPAPVYKSPPGKVDLIMDLHADKKVALAVQPTDEVGNPTTFDGTTVYAVDDASIVNLVDNGDGTAEAAATGVLGATLLTVQATRASDGKVFNGALAVQVIAGDAESFEIVAGPEEEVTPDV